MLRETIRDDGLRIITKRLRLTKKVRIDVIPRVGWAYDPPRRRGMFHFAEHAASLGTKTRSRQEIKRALYHFCNRNYGAFTGPTFMMFWGLCPHTRLGQVTDILCDVFQSPTYPDNELELTRRTINVEVVGRREDGRLDHALLKMLYEKHPIRDLLGETYASLSRISRSHLMRARRKWLTPSNTVVTATGYVNHDEFVSLVNKHLDHRQGVTASRRWPDESQIPPERRKRTIYQGGQTATILAGFKIPKVTDETLIALNVLMHMLVSAEEESMLYERIRARLGKTYTPQGRMMFVYDFANTIDFCLEMLGEHVDEIDRELVRILCKETLSEHLFDRVQDSLRHNCLVGLETPEEWSNAIRNHIVLRGLPLSWLKKYKGKLIDMFGAITYDDVVDVRIEHLGYEKIARIVARPE